MKLSLRTVITLAVGIIIGMFMPMIHTRAQNPILTQIPVGTRMQSAGNPNDCEQYYQTAMADYNNPEVGSLQALLYLACKEHSR
jgi:hypothetical protein